MSTPDRDELAVPPTPPPPSLPNQPIITSQTSAQQTPLPNQPILPNQPSVQDQPPAQPTPTDNTRAVQNPAAKTLLNQPVFSAPKPLPNQPMIPNQPVPATNDSSPANSPPIKPTTAPSTPPAKAEAPKSLPSAVSPRSTSEATQMHFPPQKSKPPATQAQHPQPVPRKPVPAPTVKPPRPISITNAAPTTPKKPAPNTDKHRAKPPSRPSRAVHATPKRAQQTKQTARPQQPAPKPSKKIVGPPIFDSDDDQRTPIEIARGVVSSSPPFLISMVIHMAALMLLALWMMPELLSEQFAIELRYAEKVGDQVKDDKVTIEPPEPVEKMDPPDVVETPVVEQVTPEPKPMVPEPEAKPVSPGPPIEAKPVESTVASGLSGRDQSMKQDLLAKFGGTESTESAVHRGLEWLARYQQRDGTWSLTGPYPNGGSNENRCAATAMALLAFQGAGNTHLQGPFKTNVSRGIAALLKMQNREGGFYEGNMERHRQYSQGQATIAVCELYGMSQDPKLLSPAQLAVDYAVRTQSPEGGWRYEPGVDADLSVTGWFVMALQSALMAGLEVPDATFENIRRFLDTVGRKDNTRYVYQALEADRAISPVMTAEALLCRQYLGWNQDDLRMASGAQFVLQHPLDWKNDRNVYYWYYASQFLHHMEGEYWAEWNSVMRDEIPKNQEATGSWNPAQDKWAASQGGRLFMTCMCIYSLEIYYRHLPIYSYQQH